ncbi:MAG: LacI family DNA-binding transcriptional regulator [Hymenobacter sp.]
MSVGTVDRVLHNRGRVSAEVRDKVLAMMQELNYEPNMIARTLGSNRTYQLATLQPDHTLDPYWQAPWDGIEKAARELKQYGITLTTYPYSLTEVESFRAQAEAATLARPDGILIAPLFYRESLAFFARWQELGIPFVLFNHLHRRAARPQLRGPGLVPERLPGGQTGAVGAAPAQHVPHRPHRRRLR